MATGPKKSPGSFASMAVGLSLAAATPFLGHRDLEQSERHELAWGTGETAAVAVAAHTA